ncbi:hypothetical protein DPMN_172518 [Dreissena polymorpha]|uniref:B box-type domain-containing protein n=1 Tax=Dreissena polymorpha TaxID=45954 RepID=A0A9D4IGP4_DREPO|nr:hypothetical protein DPMN_172518 [Dreissena polymorpha]
MSADFHGMVMCQQCLRTDKREPNCTAFCMECNESLCPACSTSHTVNKTSRHHNIKVFKDAYELNKHYEEICSISTLAKCKNHSSETVRYICYNHNLVCCEKCVLVFGEHRSCNGVVTLEELTSRGNIEAFSDLITFGKQLAEIERHSKERGTCVDNIGTQIIDATEQHVNETKERWMKDIGEFKSDFTTLQKQYEGIKLIGNDVYQYLLEHKINQMKTQMSKTIDSLKRQQACHPSIEDAMESICTKLNVTCLLPSHSATEKFAERRPVTPIKDYESVDVESRDSLADGNLTDRDKSIDPRNESHGFLRYPDRSQQLQMHEKRQRLANSYPTKVYRETKQHDKPLRYSMPLPEDMDRTVVKSVVGQPFVRFAQENEYTQLDRNWYLNVPEHVHYGAVRPLTNAWQSGLPIGKRRATFRGSTSSQPTRKKRPRSFFYFLKGKQSSNYKKR